jgi:hypothetical protein
MLSCVACILSNVVVSFSSASLIPSELPMGTEPGITDTKLLWVDGLGRLEGGLWRRLYSNEVAGHGSGPRRRGGAGRCSWRAREAGMKAKVQNNLSLSLSI